MSRLYRFGWSLLGVLPAVLPMYWTGAVGWASWSIVLAVVVAHLVGWIQGRRERAEELEPYLVWNRRSHARADD